MKDIGDWRTIVWELGSLGIAHLPYYEALSFCLDGWRIKGLETVIMPSLANDIISLQCVHVRGTPVGVIASVEAEIQVIGISDRVGGAMGCSDWLLLVLRWAWLWCHQIGTRGVAVACPCEVGIGYKNRALTGSLLFYAPVCWLTVCCAAGFSSWVLFGGSNCIWLAVLRLFSWRVSVICVMATDSDAAAGDRPGITFDVMLELDLDTVLDVLGLTGWRPEAAVVWVLQGRDEWSVRALIPDPRVMERGFHDVTIVDMGDLPEPSLSLDDLSQLRLQWPVTVLRSMVWLQQDLDSMRAAAKKRFLIPGRGIVPPVGNGLSVICTDMWRHIIWIWDSCGGARCPGAPCGRACRRTAWITSGGARCAVGH